MRLRLLLTLLPLSALASGLPDSPYLYVQGSAVESIAPDAVTLNFELSATATDLVTARGELAEKSAALHETLRRLALVENALVAHDITWRPEYDHSSDTRKLIGYVIERPHSVTLDDFTLYPQLIDRLLQLGVTRSDRVRPFLRNETALRQKLQAAAMADARKRADELAAAAGMKVVSLFAVSPVPPLEIATTILGDTPVALHKFGVTGSLIPGQPGMTYVFSNLKFESKLHAIFLIAPLH